jgi:hypothetical protein
VNGRITVAIADFSPVAGMSILLVRRWTAR